MRRMQSAAVRVGREAGLAPSFLDVDYACYRLLRHPKEFDVIVTSNLFGDILSDLGGILLGSRALTYGGNYGVDGSAFYQTNHGAAYDLAGGGRCNPLGQIFSIAGLSRMRRERSTCSWSTWSGLQYRNQGFREEIRDWLRANVPSDPLPPSGPEQAAYMRAWQRRQFHAGWAGISWPREYGGQGRSPSEQLAFIEEISRSGAPAHLHGCGESIVVGHDSAKFVAERECGRQMNGV